MKSTANGNERSKTKSRWLGTIIALAVVATVTKFNMQRPARVTLVQVPTDNISLPTESIVPSPVKEEPVYVGTATALGGTWKCCVNSDEVNDLGNHPDAKTVQHKSHDYSCLENPSNFSWYYEIPGSSRSSSSTTKTRSFQRWKWDQKSFLFVGGSTQRQMYEQYQWEMPAGAKNAQHNYAARFLFHHIEIGGCCKYDRSHILDLRKLEKDFQRQLKAGPDFVILNVATWWEVGAIGTVIDENGRSWNIAGTPKGQEWTISNQTNEVYDKPPNLSFATLMNRAFDLIHKLKHPKTKLVWRSEGHTDCPPGQSFRASVTPVLDQAQISVLNISEASCNYQIARDNYDANKRGPHLCFPSVALRHWLLDFQDQFL